MRTWLVSVFLLASFGLATMPTGCGPTEGQEQQTETTPDASTTPDNNTQDTNAPDASTTDDKPADTATADTGTTDTGAPDSGPTDETTAPDETTTDTTPTETTPDGGGTDTGGQDTPPDMTGTSLSYANDIAPLFKRANCDSGYCHGTGKGGLTISAGNAYANLVNAKSTSGAWVRVVPGDPDKSLVYEKITKDTPAEGSKMPIGSTLTASNIELIKNWILQGAKP